VVAVLIVVGSYFTAEYLRVWRPRRRGLRAAALASEPPAVVMAEICHTAELIAESEAVADAQMNATLAEAAQHPAPRPAPERATSLLDSAPAES
jgi:hypothetical protein